MLLASCKELGNLLCQPSQVCRCSKQMPLTTACAGPFSQRMTNWEGAFILLHLIHTLRHKCLAATQRHPSTGAMPSGHAAAPACSL